MFSIEDIAWVLNNYLIIILISSFHYKKKNSKSTKSKTIAQLLPVK